MNHFENFECHPSPIKHKSPPLTPDITSPIPKLYLLAEDTTDDIEIPDKTNDKSKTRDTGKDRYLIVE